ncbi:hypothetical protein AM587_10017743 [Phytophthora nicotianae]|uniref:Uncharacterized protein n=1 Tax=Phytophthora nicotianae TaxID=4792 RepID=A0A0W8BZI6_PHYNI|nr:hypothetical protein AM587_10017743 [Phytophthora nicotianae]
MLKQQEKSGRGGNETAHPGHSENSAQDVEKRTMRLSTAGVSRALDEKLAQRREKQRPARLMAPDPMDRGPTVAVCCPKDQLELQITRRDSNVQSSLPLYLYPESDTQFQNPAPAAMAYHSRLPLPKFGLRAGNLVCSINILLEGALRITRQYFKSNITSVPHQNDIRLGKSISISISF